MQFPRTPEIHMIFPFHFPCSHPQIALKTRNDRSRDSPKLNPRIDNLVEISKAAFPRTKTTFSGFYELKNQKWKRLLKGLDYLLEVSVISFGYVMGFLTKLARPFCLSCLLLNSSKLCPDRQIRNGPVYSVFKPGPFLKTARLLTGGRHDFFCDGVLDGRPVLSGWSKRSDRRTKRTTHWVKLRFTVATVYISTTMKVYPLCRMRPRLGSLFSQKRDCTITRVLA